MYKLATIGETGEHVTNPVVLLLVKLVFVHKVDDVEAKVNSSVVWSMLKALRHFHMVCSCIMFLFTIRVESGAGMPENRDDTSYNNNFCPGATSSIGL